MKEWCTMTPKLNRVDSRSNFQCSKKSPHKSWLSFHLCTTSFVPFLLLRSQWEIFVFSRTCLSNFSLRSKTHYQLHFSGFLDFFPAEPVLKRHPWYEANTRHLDLVAGSNFFLGTDTIFEPAPRSRSQFKNFSRSRYNFWTGS